MAFPLVERFLRMHVAYGAFAMALAFSSSIFLFGQVVDFERDIRPIFDDLPEPERLKLIEWAKQGGLSSDLESLEKPVSEELHGQELFELEIAPLLARSCLECHDAATKEGALDLSRKGSAFKGGDSGDAIVAGDSSR
ncbi:MAG: c-type cytochrome domain-containing protein, partial [Verrucomicrobiia bacterium]